MGAGGGTSPSVRALDAIGDKGRISGCCDEDSDIGKDRFESTSVSKEATVDAEDDRCKDGGFRYERLPPMTTAFGMILGWDLENRLAQLIVTGKKRAMREQFSPLGEAASPCSCSLERM